MNLARLSDQELMTSLREVVSDSRRLLARLLMLLIEVEERRLELAAACPSLYEFCVRRLGMSEGEACRRIGAARVLKRFPSLLPRIESGALNLSTLHALRDVLTEANVGSLAEAASHKTKRQVEEIVARLAPKPDVPPTIAALPAPAPVLPGIAAPPAPAHTPRISQLSEERFEVRFTASRELRDKIELAKERLRHRQPDGDLEVIMHRAFDALLAQLGKERLAKAKRPHENPKPTTTDRVPADVRRAVFERDGEQCTFVDEAGNRCPARGFLELDHAAAKARGGKPTVENLRVFCKPHNRYHAEQDFGRAHIDSKIRASTLDTAKRGLVHMGFRMKDTLRVLADLDAKHEALPPIEQLIREALAALT